MRNASRCIVFVASIVSVFACGGPRTYAVVGTPRDPGADAQVQVETIAGGNHMVTLEIRNLTPPERLGAGNRMYVLWFRPSAGAPVLASPIGYDAASRVGRATATTPHRNFMLLVTAEANATPSSPSETIVLQQAVQL